MNVQADLKRAIKYAYSLATTGHRKRNGHSIASTGHHKIAAGHSVVTTGCPVPGGGPVRLAQVFNALELDQAWRGADAGAIVHHGPAIELPGFDLVHSHVELLAVFARRDTEVESVSVSRVIDGLVSGVDSGDSARPILRHSGELNRRALKFALEQVGVNIAEPAANRSFGSYAELASAGTRARGPLIIGLRGMNLRRPDLRAVRLEGCCPMARSTHKRYPVQYEVHFYVKRAQPAASLTRSLEYLDIIKLRMALDNGLFSEHGGLVH